MKLKEFLKLCTYHNIELYDHKYEKLHGEHDLYLERDISSIDASDFHDLDYNCDIHYPIIEICLEEDKLNECTICKS